MTFWSISSSYNTFPRRLINVHCIALAHKTNRLLHGVTLRHHTVLRVSKVAVQAHRSSHLRRYDSTGWRGGRFGSGTPLGRGRLRCAPAGRTFSAAVRGDWLWVGESVCVSSESQQCPLCLNKSDPSQLCVQARRKCLQHVV